MSLSREVGKAVRRLRVERGLVQKQLAAKAGITPSMLSSYERGKSSPELDTLEKIMTALEVNFTDLGSAIELRTGASEPGHRLSPRSRELGKDGAASADPGAPAGHGPEHPEYFERALGHGLKAVEMILRIWHARFHRST